MEHFKGERKMIETHLYNAGLMAKFHVFMGCLQIYYVTETQKQWAMYAYLGLACLFFAYALYRLPFTKFCERRLYEMKASETLPLANKGEEHETGMASKTKS